MQNPHLEGSSLFWPADANGVLLLHGFTATTAEVRPMAKVLLQQGYTVSAPLLPGHGTYPEDANLYTWMDWVESIQKAYKELKSCCQRVVVGGESLGGVLSLYLATLYPEINGLLLYAPALKIRSPLAMQLAHLLFPFMATKKKPRSTPSAADDLWQGYTVYPLRALIQLGKIQEEVVARLHLVNQPFLVVQGRLDRSVHPSVPELLIQNTSSEVKEVQWLEQSGHCVVLEGERQKAEELTLSFLDCIGFTPTSQFQRLD